VAVTGLAHWRAERRQKRYHQPFRIAEPQWDAAERGRLARLLDDVAKAARAAEAEHARRSSMEAPAITPSAPVLKEKDLAEAATNLWRAQRRTTRLTEENSREGKRIGRLLVATKDALTEAGVQIQDHDGDEFHPGLSLEVLAYQDDPSLRVEIVQETVRPSVYLAGRRIQMGQVIVGSPAAPEREEDTSA
jgi:hypothetical protein